MERASIVRSVLVIATVGCLCASVGHFRRSLAAIEAENTAHQSEAYLLPKPDTLSSLSLGHQEMMADMIWIRALSYFAVHFVVDRDYQWLERYIDTVVALDPNFRMIYEWAGVAVLYDGNSITNEDVLLSNRFLELGLERYPDDWQLNFMLGCNYRYELMPSNEEERQAWRLLGARHLGIAGQSRDAPPWLALTASRVYERLGRQDQANRLDQQIFLSARGIGSATHIAELAGLEHLPVHFSATLARLNGAGLPVARGIPEPDWWKVLSFRRNSLLDFDQEAGLANWAFRVSVFGESDLRVDPLSPSLLDGVFFATIRDAGVHDQ